MSEHVSEQPSHQNKMSLFYISRNQQICWKVNISAPKVHCISIFRLIANKGNKHGIRFTQVSSPSLQKPSPVDCCDICHPTSILTWHFSRTSHYIMKIENMTFQCKLCLQKCKKPTCFPGDWADQSHKSVKILGKDHQQSNCKRGGLEQTDRDYDAKYDYS